MGDRSKIEWTDASWNPVTGCTEVSAGCDNCYAATLARGKLASAYSRQLPVVDTPENRADPFAVRLWPDRLDRPARWRRPRRIFVNSMSDLFHKDVPDSFIVQAFQTMAEADWHTYQILTKRPARAARFLDKHRMFLPSHIWLGTSIEDQSVDNRLRNLLDCKADTRFLSVEPLIGPLVLGDGLALIDWVIVGGESGKNARPMHPDWARSIRDECQRFSVPFFFKQWGEWSPESVACTPRTAESAVYLSVEGTARPAAYGSRGELVTMQRVGKRKAGRQLDGRTWDEYPVPALIGGEG